MSNINFKIKNRNHNSDLNMKYRKQMVDFVPTKKIAFSLIQKKCETESCHEIYCNNRKV